MKTMFKTLAFSAKRIIKTYYCSILLAIFVLPLAAQPTFIGTMLSDGNYQTYNLDDLGAFRQVRLTATSSAAADTRIWEFATGNYFENWRPYTFPTTTSYNGVIDPSINTASARYNSSFGGSSSYLPAITSGRNYTINVTEFAPPADQFMAILETSFTPISIDVLTATPSSGVSENVPVSIEITTSAAPSSGEQVYLRYSTDNFVTSTLTQFSFSGSTGTAQIPGFVENTTVQYYVYSSNISEAQILSDVASVGELAHDILTLNLKNDAGLPYSYVVQAILPIDLISFEAKPNSNKITLSWHTASEVNSSHFELEKSKDAIDWKNIAQLTAKGSYVGNSSYSFDDNHPTLGSNFYRLKQVDFDGQHEYSQVVVARANSSTEVQIYPNPASNRIFIISDNNEAAVVSLIDQNGQNVFSGKLYNNAIDISHLHTGFYILEYVINDYIARKPVFIN